MYENEFTTPPASPGSFPVFEASVNSYANPPESLDELKKLITNRVIKMLRRSAHQGFLGGMPIPDQIDHALGFVFAAESTLKRPPRSLVDLGAGGGIPGLVLVASWPECQVVLLDASERRTEFLVTETGGWEREGSIEVVRGRAEEIGRDIRLRHQFELVTSRSFGSPAVTAECAAPLLSLDGVLVVSEPPDGTTDERWPIAGLSQVGLEPSHHVRFDNRFGYQVLRQAELTPNRYPRRVGIPSKRPLF